MYSESDPLSVYVISEHGGLTKIGISAIPSYRLKGLQSERRKRLRLVFSATRLNGDAKLIEKTAHYLLAAKRVEGEWFNVSIDDAIAALRNAIDMVDSGQVQMPCPGNVLGLRMGARERKALERAALADNRSLSALVRKILESWLVKEGWMKEPRK